MSEKLELEIKKRAIALQRAIETATGESYNDLTEAVQVAKERAEDEALWYEITKAWTGYQARFSNAPITRLPKRLSFEKATNLNSTFDGCYLLERIDVMLGNEKVSNHNYMCRGCSKLTFVYGVETSGSTTFGNVFAGCYELETIYMPLNLQKSTTTNYSSFTNCKKLKNISFVENTIKIAINFPDSPLLTDESIQSIINGLATVSTAQTLTFHKDVKAKLKTEQLTTITNKNWTLA